MFHRTCVGWLDQQRNLTTFLTGHLSACHEAIKVLEMLGESTNMAKNNPCCMEQEKIIRWQKWHACSERNSKKSTNIWSTTPARVLQLQWKI